jgi:hypothetical protein
LKTLSKDLKARLGKGFSVSMRVGWKGLERIYYTVLHFDIKEGKVWLQHNATDIDIGQELVEMGISKEDIVLGLHPPYKRPYTSYGVA